MSETTVVHFHSVKEHWDKVAQAWDNEQYVYIGRRNKHYNLPQSVWANPFRATTSEPGVVQRVIEQYRRHIMAVLRDATVGEEQIEELRGKTLVCWCKKHGNEPCHGDVLLEIIRERAFDPYGAEAVEAYFARPLDAFIPPAGLTADDPAFLALDKEYTEYCRGAKEPMAYQDWLECAVIKTREKLGVAQRERGTPANLVQQVKAQIALALGYSVAAAYAESCNAADLAEQIRHLRDLLTPFAEAASEVPDGLRSTLRMWDGNTEGAVSGHVHFATLTTDHLLAARDALKDTTGAVSAQGKLVVDLTHRLEKAQAMSRVQRDTIEAHKEQFRLSHDNATLLYNALSKHAPDALAEIKDKLHYDTTELDKVVARMLMRRAESHSQQHREMWAEALGEIED